MLPFPGIHIEIIMTFNAADIRNGMEIKMKKKILFLATLLFSSAVCVGTFVLFRKKRKELENNRQIVYKNDKIIQNLDEFLTIKQAGKNISIYFENTGYKKVAIYGMGYLGKRLYDELKSLDIEVAYLVDKDAENINEEVPVFKPDQKLPYADVLIVTPVFYFHAIENEMERQVNCPIISLEDVLDEVLLSEY